MPRDWACRCRLSVLLVIDRASRPDPDRIQALFLRCWWLEQVLFDLGCGDGRICIEAAESRGAKACGAPWIRLEPKPQNKKHMPLIFHGVMLPDWISSHNLSFALRCVSEESALPAH